MMRRPIVLMLFLLSGVTAQGEPGYQPQQQLAGTLSIWGHGAYGKRLSFVEGLVGAWEDGFRRYHPGIEFDNRLYGTASAMGALYTGTGDLALLGREIWQPEIDAFNEVFGYPPTGIDVMTGSFNVRNKGYAIVVFVHKDNPVQGLSLDQLDAIFGVERRRGHKPVVTWGDLGLTGDRGNQEINLYGLPIARGFAAYLEDRVFLGSRLWNPSIREFPDEPNSVSVNTDGANRMLAKLANDPYGIGYAGLVYNHPGVRALPLAESDGDVRVTPSMETVADHSYPLTRIITMFINKVPGKAAEPNVTEFLRFILSREGQQIVRQKGGGYLPLPTEVAARELSKLAD